MKRQYTMAEFIEEFKLGVSVHDAGATRMIAARLKKLGFKPIRRRYGGKVHIVWEKDLEIQRKLLAEKLEGIK